MDGKTKLWHPQRETLLHLQGAHVCLFNKAWGASGQRMPSSDCPVYMGCSKHLGRIQPRELPFVPVGNPPSFTAPVPVLDKKKHAFGFEQAVFLFYLPCVFNLCSWCVAVECSVFLVNGSNASVTVLCCHFDSSVWHSDKRCCYSRRFLSEWQSRHNGMDGVRNSPSVSRARRP